MRLLTHNLIAAHHELEQVAQPTHIHGLSGNPMTLTRDDAHAGATTLQLIDHIDGTRKGLNHLIVDAPLIHDIRLQHGEALVLTPR